MKEDLSEQSQRTASAISLGFPKRPRGCMARTRLLTCGSAKARSAMAVSITAGQTALTRILFEAQPGAFEIDVDDGVPIFLGLFDDGLPLSFDACIIEGQIEAAKLFDGFL